VHCLIKETLFANKNYGRYFFSLEFFLLLLNTLANHNFELVIMRCCGAGGAQPDKEEVRANKSITKQLKKDQEDFDNEMKLLLLGNLLLIINIKVIHFLFIIIKTMRNFLNECCACVS